LRHGDSRISILDFRLGHAAVPVLVGGMKTRVRRRERSDRRWAAQRAGGLPSVVGPVCDWPQAVRRSIPPLRTRTNGFIDQKNTASARAASRASYPTPVVRLIGPVPKSALNSACAFARSPTHANERPAPLYRMVTASS